MRTLDLLASDSSHLPFLYVFKESRVMEKYGFEIDLHIVGGAKAPTMAHRARLALAGEIDFLSRDEARRVLNQYGEEKIAPDDIVIGTIAHNYKTKGLPNLRAAFSLVQKDFPKVKLSK